MASRDALFLKFVKAMIAIVVMFGIGMTIVIIYGDISLASKMLTIFTNMFTAVMGLGTGYLLGSVPPLPPTKDE